MVLMLLAALSIFISGYVTGFSRCTIRRSKRQLVLCKLWLHEEMQGKELNKAASANYGILDELEKEGLIVSRSDGVAHPERGGLPKRFYRLTDRGLWAARATAHMEERVSSPANPAG